MKYISRHPRTLDLLEEWAYPKQLIVASFFFWSSGTRNQKSQIGLLRSLLFQVFRQCPELISVILPDPASYLDEFHQWTFDRLHAAFSQLKSQKQMSTRFCFFIDGLDEFDGKTNEGSHQKLVKSLQTLADRPWNVFKDAFGKSAHHNIALHDLNRGDIHNYVQQTFAQDQRFVELEHLDPRYSTLVKDIVEKAQGVFLWVFLVVQSLKEGLQNSDRVVDLERRLDKVPADLEKYFEQILGSIDDVYKYQALQTFTIALHAEEPLSTLEYFFIDEDPDYAFGTLPELSLVQIQEKNRIMERRLDGRSKGLLEVRGDFYDYTDAYPIDTEPIDTYFTETLPVVDFLHKSVDGNRLTSLTYRRYSHTGGIRCLASTWSWFW
ncbi:hypothetical protein K490DRAFT_76387 [Saccharata proteae CBS 121410]|uniref:NACHT domain-containing protein n=1 Tax=Saccharata proteae CBS 121410 TaxID=1314787 RepID=A0A9P4LW47_9PEZI|nr:hypothetical protein K490DRAFT_76387 [Saccharata proteae CBS 121410]